MTEMDILELFYDEMTNKGIRREVVSINIDENALGILAQKLKKTVSLQETLRLTDICIANEWVARTTIDPGYNYLTLTEAGLQVILAHQYHLQQQGVPGSS